MKFGHGNKYAGRVVQDGCFFGGPAGRPTETGADSRGAARVVHEGAGAASKAGPESSAGDCQLLLTQLEDPFQISFALILFHCNYTNLRPAMETFGGG